MDDFQKTGLYSTLAMLLTGFAAKHGLDLDSNGALVLITFVGGIVGLVSHHSASAAKAVAVIEAAASTAQSSQASAATNCKACGNPVATICPKCGAI